MIIKHTISAEGVEFRASEQRNGRFLGLLRRVEETQIRVDDWSLKDGALLDAMARLKLVAEEIGCHVRFDDESVFADHRAISQLSNRQAKALGLPPVPPLVFEADTTGNIGGDGFALVYRWLRAGQREMTQRNGAFLTVSDGSEYRIPDPIFSAIEIADDFSSTRLEGADHWSSLAAYRRSLDPAAGNGTDDGVERQMPDALRKTRIYPAAAFSLDLKEVDGEVLFDPVPFSRETVQNRESGDEGGAAAPLVAGLEGLLPSGFLNTFQTDPRTGFQSTDAVKPTYLLASGEYLLLDDDLVRVMQVVRDKQKVPPAERRAFAANPKAALKDALMEGGAELSAEQEEALDAQVGELFQETVEFADRAYGIGLWEKPVLSYVQAEANQWLPEVFPISVGGRHYHVAPEEVEPLRQKVEKAIREGRETVEHNGDLMPAGPEALERLETVRARIAQIDNSESRKGNTETEEEREEKTAPAGKMVLQVWENFEDVKWGHERPKRAQVSRELPKTIKTVPFAHQQAGIEAMIDTWCSELPGFLQADDQGLGKTYQTLAFLAWLRGAQQNQNTEPPVPRGPILIVAPTSLLRTWENEADDHLNAGVLGAAIPVYGSHTKKLKSSDGKDLTDGIPRLDFSKVVMSIQKGEGHRYWLLTTYDTLANYQHSFHQIEFSAVVFDEIQKIKNPDTINAQAAKSVRADFRIGLTGTPIENHIGDLWAVMDVIAPGFLGSLRGFMQRFQPATEENMTLLHNRLFQPSSHEGAHLPPIAIRRMKDDVLECLKRKDFRLYPREMSGGQASAYDEIREKLKDAARGSALKLLHHIRSVSLHYENPVQNAPVSDGEAKSFMDDSARLKTTFEILDQLKDRGERALVFVEDKDMQQKLAIQIKRLYGLNQVSIINGQTSIPQRQARVERFQHHLTEDGGFDVMILGPKAAGVGLTLTAATHVIHLSRWWNPAVEDQCNDRIYRIGQSRDVTIHMPMAIHPAYRERSFDCILNELMTKKRSLARAALWPPVNQDQDHAALMNMFENTAQVDLDEIGEMDPQMFEWFVVDRANNQQWQSYATPLSGDGGSDGYLKHRYRKDSWCILQMKHTSDKDRVMDSQGVLDTLRAREKWGKPNPQLVVVTNAREFDTKARKLARENDVRLVTRDRLCLWPDNILA